MSVPARPDAPGGGVHQEAVASGHGVVNQAGRDQHIHLGDGVRRVLQSGDGADAVCPYPGLAAFTREQAEWFFGRERLKADLVGRLDAAVADGGPVMVVAASGAGKSSLLRAGLLHDIASGKLGAEGSRDWPQAVIVPGAHPMHEAAAALAAASPGAAAQRPSQAPGADDLDALLLSLARAASVPRRPAARVVLVVDQFEELFTLCDSEAERAEFVSWLWRAPDPRRAGGPLAVVACGLRADFYAQCIAAHQELRRSLQADQVVVGPMSEDELRQAITIPAQMAGMEIDPGLADLLLSDLRASRDRRAAPDGEKAASYDVGRLPLLAHALRATWQQRHRSALTVDGYRNTGGIDHAIAETADHVYARLDPAGQREAKLMFLRLVKIGDTLASDARRPLARSDLAASAAAGTVLDRYISSRLLTSTRDAVQITHEALLSAWPKLKDWLNEDRAGNLTRQRIEDTAAEWDRARDASLLYRGTSLETAATWASIHPGELAPLAHKFLDASRRLARRATSIRRGVIAGLTALTLIATAAAGLAVWQARAASEQRDQAVFNQTSADALALSESNTPLAADINVAAHDMNPSSSADSTIGSRLISSENTPLSTSLDAGSGAVYGLALSKNGRLLVTTGADDPLRLWTVTSAGHARLESSTKPPIAGGLDSAALTPDGRLLAVGSSAATVVALYDVSDPVHPALLGRFPGKGTVSGLAVSPDGRLLAVGRSDGQVQLWNAAEPAHLSQVGNPLTASEIEGRAAGLVRALAFSPDGRELASGGEDGIIRMWSLADPAGPQLRAQVPAAGTNAGIAASETGTGATAVDSVSFSPDGQMLVSTDVDDTIELWSVASPASLQLLGQPSAPNTDEVFTAAFSPDGSVLASAGYDGAVRLWNIADPHRPQPLGQPLTAGTGTVYSVAFGPDGTTLDSGGQDGTVRLWSLPRTLLTGPAGQVDSVAFSPDKRTMATSGAEGKVRLWDVTDPASPRSLGTPLTFGGGTSEVVSVRISPNGRLLAASDYAGVIQLWDISDPTHPRPVGNGLNIDGRVSGILNYLLGGRLGTGQGSDPMYSIAFSPNGQTLAVGDSLGLTWLFSITDPANPALVGMGIPKHSGSESVESMAFSPDGRELAVSYSGDDGVVLWNVVSDPAPVALTGKPFPSGTLISTSLAFTPDGRRLAVGNGDGSVQLWNVANPANPRPLVTLISGRGVAISPVDSVAVNPSGQLLAAGHDDGTVSVWNLVTASSSPDAEQMLLTTDTNRVNAVAFSPDGTLATGSTDETVRLWNLNVQAAIARVCALAGSDLTSTQWDAYIPQFRYRPLCPA